MQTALAGLRGTGQDPCGGVLADCFGMSGAERDWYSVEESAEIEQGDLLSECPVPLVEISAEGTRAGATLSAQVEVHDLCVLTQTCDLVQDKVQTVLLGQVLTWDKVVEARKAQGDHGYGKEGMRKKLKAGNMPDLCLLHRRREEPRLAWSVVNFHSLFVLPKKLVREHAARMGPRLRLRPPYREHLAQAFARYFMRVGLPHDADAFIKDPAD